MIKEIIINPNILSEYFSLKVREQCKSCKRFNKKNTCPDKIESFDYFNQLLPIYSKGIIYYKKFIIDSETNWRILGRDSSLDLHRFLLAERDKLFNLGNYFNVAFIGGSCKLCSVCSHPCKYPNKALVPLEATGIDVVRLMLKFNIKIKFPVKDAFYRIGMILYD